MAKPITEFNKKGLPEIMVYEDFFKIKSQDFWEFREFKYDELEKIKYYNPNNNWYTNTLLLFTSLITRIASQKQYYYLKIIKKNGGSWKYKHSNTINFDLVKVLKEIEKQAGNIKLEIN